MKKLLFTGLMIFSLFSIAAENELKNSEKEQNEIYLKNYFQGKMGPYGKELQDLDCVDCSAIRALSDEAFAGLIKAAIPVIYSPLLRFCFKSSIGHEQQKEETKNKVYKALKLINQCRSVAPILNDLFYPCLKEIILNGDYDALEEQIKYKFDFFKYCPVITFGRYHILIPVPIYTERPLDEFEGPGDRFIFTRKNLPKLREMRDHIRAEQK